MIVLHAGAVKGQRILWGETPAGPPRRKQNKMRKIPPTEIFPYDAGKKEMQAALMKKRPGVDFALT